MVKLLVVLISVFTIFSCSPQKEKCDINKELLKIKKYQQELSKVKKVKGVIYMSGFPALFLAKLKPKGEITVFDPFGRKLVKLKEEEKVCLETKSEKICETKRKIYKKFLNLDIPIDIKGLIIGKVNINSYDSIKCIPPNEIVIQKNNITYFFEKGLLKQVKYKQYFVDYIYKTNMLNKISVKDKNETILKIKIKKLENE